MTGVARAYGFWFLKHRPVPPPPLPPAVHVTLAPLPPVAVEKPVPGDPTRGVVSLNCGEQTGAGFFIGPDQLMTNAHVLCGAKLPLIVSLRDGRRLLGTVSAKDDWLDLARIDVPGADAEPLAVGDTTALKPGDAVRFIGTPKGMPFTVHDGRVSFVGRNHLGVAYVQLNANVNPGNSGGPLLDSEGRVLGIVSMKVLDGEGMGLALPIEYARAPVEGPALTRWQDTLKRVAEEDVRDQIAEANRLAPGKSKLVAVQQVEGHGLAAVVMLRWTQDPHALQHDFTLGPAGCTVRANVSGWVPLAEAIEKAHDPRRMAWMMKHKLAEGVRVGAGVLEPVDCPPSKLTGVATLGLGDEKLTIDAADLLLPVEKKRAEAAQQATQAADDARATREAEARWRGRFTDVRKRIATAIETRASAQKQIDAADDLVLSRRGTLNAEGQRRYQGWKDDVVRADKEKANAESDLHELERQAANEAVPFEWRK